MDFIRKGSSPAPLFLVQKSTRSSRKGLKCLKTGSLCWSRTALLWQPGLAPSLESLETTWGARHYPERAHRWCLRAMQAQALGQSGFCGSQHVSSHPWPRRQGPTTPLAPCPKLPRWAGRGHIRTLAPRQGSCSVVVSRSDAIFLNGVGPLDPFLTFRLRKGTQSQILF